MEANTREEALWRNCADSVTHALEHFSAGAAENDPFHHRKWAILSVDHAAEVYCNLLLCTFEPTRPDDWYPPLGKAAEALKGHPRLLNIERFVIGEVLPLVRDGRNILMHGPAPEDLNVVDAAIVLLALLFLLRRRLGLRSTEFLDQSPIVELDVLEDLTWQEQERWFKIAERLVADEYGERLDGCDNCGSFAVPPDMVCQACFNERRPSP